MKSKKQNTKKIIQQLERDSEQWKKKYLRALADYQNLEKRTSSERQKEKKLAAEEVLRNFLPIVDTIKRAQVHLQDEGLGLGLSEIDAFLENQGVKKITTVGKKFNPHEMECLEVVKGKPNIIIEEVLAGYKLHGKVLRVAQVNVGKK